MERGKGCKGEGGKVYSSPGRHTYTIQPGVSKCIIHIHNANKKTHVVPFGTLRYISKYTSSTRSLKKPGFNDKNLLFGFTNYYFILKLLNFLSIFERFITILRNFTCFFVKKSSFEGKIQVF